MLVKKTITPIAVAHYFLKKAIEEGGEITNLKMQKLVYYSAVWFFTLKNKKLFNDRIEAWIHGPAIPRLYGHFKEFGSNPIRIDGLEKIELPFNVKEKAFLDDIWSVYGKYDASYLEALTHSELPWREARKGLDPAEPSKRTIDLQKAKSFYAQRLAESK